MLVNNVGNDSMIYLKSNLGLVGGYGMVVQSAMSTFPLDFNPLLQLSTALAQSGENSAKKVTTLKDNRGYLCFVVIIKKHIYKPEILIYLLELDVI